MLCESIGKGGHTLELRVVVGASLSLHQPLSLWWKLIHYLGTQSHSDVRVSTVYLAQVSLSTHLSTNPSGRNQTRVSRFVVRHANHCTTEMLVDHDFHNINILKCKVAYRLSTKCDGIVCVCVCVCVCVHIYLIIFT